MSPDRNVEAVLVCEANACRQTGSPDFAKDLQAKLKEAGSDIQVASQGWCLLGCGHSNIILWPDGPIYKFVDRHPIDDVVALITNGTPIEGIKTSDGAEWRYISGLLGRRK